MRGTKKSYTPQNKLCRFPIVQNVQKLDSQGRISDMSWSEMSCHHDMPTQLADLVPWVMVVCVCLCVFPTGLSKVLPQLYVFRPSLFLCNVKCSVLTCTLSLEASQYAQPLFLSLLFVLFACSLSVCPAPSLFPARMYLWTHACMLVWSIWSVFSTSRPKLCCSCITCRGTEMFIWGMASWNIWRVS